MIGDWRDEGKRGRGRRGLWVGREKGVGIGSEGRKDNKREETESLSYNR